jgi:hypothetical protein
MRAGGHALMPVPTPLSCRPLTGRPYLPCPGGAPGAALQGEADRRGRTLLHGSPGWAGAGLGQALGWGRRWAGAGAGAGAGLGQLLVWGRRWSGAGAGLGLYPGAVWPSCPQSTSWPGCCRCRSSCPCHLRLAAPGMLLHEEPGAWAWQEGPCIMHHTTPPQSPPPPPPLRYEAAPPRQWGTRLRRAALPGGHLWAPLPARHHACSRPHSPAATCCAGPGRA